MIPDTLLAGIRAAAETALVDSCVVSRPGTPALDDAGGETVTYTTVLSGVRCMLRPAGVQAEEATIAGGIRHGAVWILRLPAGTDVRVGDRIVVTTSNGTKTLEALPPQGEATFEPLRQVACYETG